MKVRFCVGVLVLICATAADGWAADIRGKVTDAQGEAVADVAIIVGRDGSPSDTSTVTAQDGTFSLADLPAATYTLLARKTGFAELKQQVRVVDNRESTTVNLRLSPNREPEAVRGAEERNPNDFVIRLDTNSIKNEQARTGASLRLIPEFRATGSYYGEQFGVLLRGIPATSNARPAVGFHGSLYEFHQNNRLTARPFFQAGSVLPLRRNQYGFSIGGPIQAEKLWFNFAWDQVRDSGFVNGNVQVPLASERTPQSSDPRMNAIISSLLKAYPDELPNLPQVSLRHLNTNALRDIRSTAFSWRLDYRAGSSHSLVMEHQFLDYTEEPFELVLGQNPRTLMRPQRAGVTYSRTFSPRTVFQAGLHYQRLAIQLLPTKRFLELVPAALLPFGTPDVELGDEITPLGLVNQGVPRGRWENHYYLTPQLSHSRGRHNLVAGASIEHRWDSDLRNFNSRATVTFLADCVAIGSDPCRPRSAVQNFLLGAATRMNIARPNQYAGFRNWENALYVQDRFQYRPNLSLTAGMRYELVTVPREIGQIFRFKYKTDANNFAPQAGFAWNPRSGRTVVRGGYGVAFASITMATFSREANSVEHIKSVGIITPAIEDWLTIPSFIPNPTRRGNTNRVDPGAVSPYVHTYNLYVERELPGQALFRVGYLGSRAFKLWYGAAYNRAVPVPGIPATSATVNQRRPDPQYARIFTLTNASTAYLDALQATLIKRRSWGLNFEGTYTFSKAISTGVGNVAESGNGDDLSQSTELVSDMRGLASFDTPHAFTLNYSYELPSLGGAMTWVGRLLGGWVVSGTTVLRSGTPFTIYTGSDAPGWGNVDGEDRDRPNIKNPAILGASIDDPDTSAALLGADVPCSDRGAYVDCKYFDTHIVPGGRGNIGYRTFRKDGTNNFNIALSRGFTLNRSERQLQFRAEFFNALNHAQFAAPGFVLASPTFGKITNTVNKGRVVQLTLRYTF